MKPHNLNEEVSFTLTEVPRYLRSSEFYLSLQDNEDHEDKITLTKIHFKSNLYVKSTADMSHLLSTMRFWGVCGIPRELVMYVANNPETDLHSTLTEFTNELKCVAFLEQLGTQLQNIYPKPFDQYISIEKVKPREDTMQRLIDLLTLQFTHKRGQIWNEATTELAAQLGWLDCLTFLHEHGCAWDESTCTAAAGYNHFECLQYAHVHRCPWNTKTTSRALGRHNTKCFQYARDHGCAWDASMCAVAARNANLTLLMSAHESGCPWDETTCQEACYGNSLDCLKYAHEQKCPWDCTITSTAAHCDRLLLLMYAHENGCPWDATTCEKAARGASLSCLQYAHEQHCPWDESTCIGAAYSGSLICLEYAHMNGCPWGEKTMEAAATRGNLTCLKYLFEHNCPGRQTACMYARSVECITYLREMQCPWGIDVSNAQASTYGENCLQYCIEHGCPVNAETALCAATDLSKLKILQQCGKPCWDKQTLQKAAQYKKVDCFQFLLEHNCPGKDDIVLLSARHYPLLLCAHTHGCVLLPEAYRSAALGDRPLQCVKFLFEHHCPYPPGICTTFATYKRADCLQYAHETGAPWSADTYRAAEHLLHFWSDTPEDEVVRSQECIQYLREHGCPQDTAATDSLRQTLWLSGLVVIAVVFFVALLIIYVILLAFILVAEIDWELILNESTCF